MNEIEHALGHMILEMRKGRDVNDISNDLAIESTLDEDGLITVDKNDLIAATRHVIYDLYEGKFPINHLEVGDICYDTIGNKCIVTNIDKSIHVLYPNGKTHRFPIYLENQFKKTNISVKKNLLDILLYLKESEE